MIFNNRNIFSLKRAKDYNLTNLNEESRCLFIHIPKNAGTSVCNALGFDKSSHRTAIEYKKILGLKYETYFKFCFVRNPFSRFISLYNYARMKESYYHSAINPEKSLYGKHLDYDILKEATIDECAELLLDNKLVHSHNHIQWWPQTKWIFDENGKMIVDFIGRVEYLDSDFSLLGTRIGITQKLNSLNKSSSSDDYKNLISEKTRSILELYYKDDFEYLGYKF